LTVNRRPRCKRVRTAGPIVRTSSPLSTNEIESKKNSLLTGNEFQLFPQAGRPLAQIVLSAKLWVLML